MCLHLSKSAGEAWQPHSCLARLWYRFCCYAAESGFICLQHGRRCQLRECSSGHMCQSPGMQILDWCRHAESAERGLNLQPSSEQQCVLLSSQRFPPSPCRLALEAAAQQLSRARALAAQLLPQPARGSLLEGRRERQGLLPAPARVAVHQTACRHHSSRLRQLQRLQI